MDSFDLATVEAPFFEPLIGQRFAAAFTEAPDAPPLDLELTHVLPSHVRPGTVARAPFSLLFKASEPARMAQGTYEVRGAGLERAAIFLVPIYDPSWGICMEAAFN